MWMNESLRRLLGYGLDEDLSAAIVADFYEEPEYERILLGSLSSHRRERLLERPGRYAHEGRSLRSKLFIASKRSATRVAGS